MCPDRRVNTLKKKSEFNRLFSNNQIYRCRYFKVIYRRENTGKLTFAISISRKTEILATKRNKGKRRIRMIIKKISGKGPPGATLLFVPTKSMLDPKTKFKEIEKEIHEFFRKISKSQ